jgi:hypothetical protein
MEKNIRSSQLFPEARGAVLATQASRYILFFKDQRSREVNLRNSRDSAYGDECDGDAQDSDEDESDSDEDELDSDEDHTDERGYESSPC